jgi:regulatory protein
MPSAYLDGLKMLARRELSETQVRQRLDQKGHDPESVEAAIQQLKREHAIDDARTAEAIARTETSTRHRGKLRVRLQIERAGISSSTARRVVDEVFGAIDDDALIDAALAKRLRTGAAVADDAHFARLYRYLLGQGFDADKVVRLLKARSVK